MHHHPLFRQYISNPPNIYASILPSPFPSQSDSYSRRAAAAMSAAPASEPCTLEAAPTKVWMGLAAAVDEATPEGLDVVGAAAELPGEV